MESINDRISVVIKHLKLTRAAFAKSLGTSSSRIANITQGRNKPDSQLLTSIIATYPDVDAAWLLTGEGDIVRNVAFPRPESAEVYSEGNMSDTLLTTLPSTLLDTLQPPKKADLRGKKGPFNSLTGSNDVPSAALIAAHFDMESLERRQSEMGDTYGRIARSAEYAVELHQNQHWLSIDRQLDLVLSRLLRVQELLQDLLGIRFDYAKHEALKKKIVQRPHYDEEGYPSDPIAEMTETQKRAYYASRERLLEQCEGQLTELLKMLHNGIMHPKSDYPPLRKGSAGEALRPFLDQRHREIYGEDENE